MTRHARLGLDREHAYQGAHVARAIFNATMQITEIEVHA